MTSKLARAMPAFVRRALEEEDLSRAYERRPAYQRDDYVGWVSRARLPQTRRRRLDQMLRELRAGDVYMGAAWHPRQPHVETASPL